MSSCLIQNTHNKDIKGPENPVFDGDGRFWCVNHDSSQQAQGTVLPVKLIKS